MWVTVRHTLDLIVGDDRVGRMVYLAEELPEGMPPVFASPPPGRIERLEWYSEAAAPVQELVREILEGRLTAVSGCIAFHDPVKSWGGIIAMLETIGTLLPGFHYEELEEVWRREP